MNVQTYSEREIGRPAVNMESVGYRIRRVDRYNFELQRWIPPGEKKNGKKSAGKWTGDGYFPRLDQAAQMMFERLVLEGPEVPTLADLIRDVARAQAQVAHSVRQFLADSLRATSAQESA